MENEELQAQEEVVEQEEQQVTEDTPTEEEVQEDDSDVEEETVTLKKSDFTKMKRQATAYVATKNVKPERTEIIKKPANDVSMEKLERIELRQDGYSKEEVDEIMDLGGTKVLGSKLVQAAIKAMRAEKKSKDATPEFSAKSPVYKKYTQDDLKNMSSADLEKILPHA